MEDGPFFSVIVPAFNAERFLPEALESVRHQSFDRFECIVVDDGSTDRTVQIAREFEADPRFRTLELPHGGSPGRARNHGIGQASGGYVAFVDADDAWLPDKLAAFHAHLERSAAPILFSNGYVVDDDGRRISELLSRRMKQLFPPRDPLLLTTNLVPVPSATVRREVMLRTPFSEDVRIRGLEDYKLWLTLNRELPLHYLPEPLLLYRCHAGQMHRGPLEQLEMARTVLSGEAMAGAYEESAVQLGVELLDVRAAFYRDGPLLAGRRALPLVPRLLQPRGRVLRDYVRFGLMQRSRTIFRQRAAGALVGV